VDKSGFKQLRVLEKVDTIYQPIPFEIKEDSLRLKRCYIDAAWKPKQEYQLEMDSATIFDIYGLANKKFEKKFRFKTEEEYGKILLNVKGVTVPVIVQLYKSEEGKSENGKRKYNILSEKKMAHDGTLTFELLPEGKYKFRAILDANGNGVWDTGLYLKQQQPEEIVYMPVEMVVKHNSEYEQEFDLRQKNKKTIEKEK
jgi:hypothetical protein